MALVNLNSLSIKSTSYPTWNIKVIHSSTRKVDVRIYLLLALFITAEAFACDGGVAAFSRVLDSAELEASNIARVSKKTEASSVQENSNRVPSKSNDGSVNHLGSDLVDADIFYPKAALLLKERLVTKNSLTSFDIGIEDSAILTKKLEDFDNKIIELMRKEVSLADISKTKEGLTLGDREFKRLGSLLGSMNKGIFESSDGATIIKKVEGLNSSTLKEMYWSLQVEKLGGPKLKGVYRNKEGDVFFEMEKVYAGTDAATLKDIRIGEGSGQDFYNKFRSKEFLDTLVDQLAKRFKDTTESKILPMDSDFMVNSKGELRWLDVGFWNVVVKKEDVISQMDNFLKGMNERPFPPDISDRVFKKYFELLEDSKMVSKEELEIYKRKYESCPCNTFSIQKSF